MVEHNKRRNRQKILTRTSQKVIIKMNYLVEVLNEEEISQFHHILDKLRIYDEEHNQGN